MTYRYYIHSNKKFQSFDGCRPEWKNMIFYLEKTKTNGLIQSSDIVDCVKRFNGKYSGMMLNSHVDFDRAEDATAFVLRWS